MRRLDPEEAAAALARAAPVADARPSRRVARRRLVGRDPSGGPVEVALEGRCLVVFCSTTCAGCADLAALVAAGTPDAEVLGALRSPDGGLPDAAVTAFTVAGGRWVLGDDAFDALDVRAAPFFCLVDARGVVEVEGLAFGRAHVEGHVAAALEGRPRPDAVRLVADP